MVYAALIWWLLGSGVVYAQTSVDSILIYDTIREADHIRRIIRQNFSLLNSNQQQQVARYDSLMSAGVDSGQYPAAAVFSMKAGDIFFRAGLYIRASEDYLRAAEYALKSGDSVKAAIAYMRIGRVYYFASTGDFQEMYRKAYQLLKNSRDKVIKNYSLYVYNLNEEDKEADRKSVV